MGKQFYAALFIQLTVPLLDCFICYSTHDWLERTSMKDFLIILFYREIFDIIINLVNAILMVCYRFCQTDSLAKAIVTLTGITIFVNFIFLAPFVFAPQQYFRRFKPIFYKNYSQPFFVSLTYLYKCCGFIQATEIKGQKCRSTRNACIPAIIKSISPSIRSKVILAIFLAFLQALATYMIWLIQVNGEKIEESEEEEEENEETPLMKKKLNDPEREKIKITRSDL